MKKNDNYRTYDDEGNPSKELTDLKNERLKNNKETEFAKKRGLPLNKKLEAIDKIINNNNLKDLFKTKKDKVPLTKIPTQLEKDKANECLTRIIYKTKYNGEDIQRAALNRELKPSQPHSTNKKAEREEIGKKTATNFIVNGEIVNNWCIDVPSGAVYTKLNKNTYLNACDYVASINGKLYAIEAKSNTNNSKNYIKNFIDRVKSSHNNVTPICIVPNKKIYDLKEQFFLKTPAEFSSFVNICKQKNTFKILRNKEELVSFLWAIYSETGKKLLPEKSFSLSDGVVNARVENSYNFEKYMNKYGEEHPELVEKQKQKEQENKNKQYPNVKKALQASVQTYFNY